MHNKHQMDLLEGWRAAKVLPSIRGSLLDLGCGYNNLVKSYGNGIGVDVYPWLGIQVQVGNSAYLPFADHSFDTVTIIAALNHIPNRDEAIKEVYRVLNPDGSLIITMIGPITGRIAHLFFTHDEKTRQGMEANERLGMSRQEILNLLGRSGFAPVKIISFQFGLNSVYIARKHDDGVKI
jgi:SAM-dependent methyltransferase